MGVLRKFVKEKMKSDPEKIQSAQFAKLTDDKATFIDSATLDNQNNSSHNLSATNSDTNPPQDSTAIQLEELDQYFNFDDNNDLKSRFE